MKRGENFDVLLRAKREENFEILLSAKRGENFEILLGAKRGENFEILLRAKHGEILIFYFARSTEKIEILRLRYLACRGSYFFFLFCITLGT